LAFVDKKKRDADYH